MAFLLDEALGVRLDIDRLRQAKATRLPRGLRYAAEDEYEDPLPIRPVAPGPASELHRAA